MSETKGYLFTGFVDIIETQGMALGEMFARLITAVVDIAK
jgi:hypothetical protein